MSFTNLQTPPEERKPDYDMQAAFKESGMPDIKNVVAIYAHVPGENDGPAWHWVVRMKDGTCAVVRGGCDYTGWGCQSGASLYGLAASPEDAVELADTEIDQQEKKYDPYPKDILFAQIRGEHPFGVGEITLPT